MSDEIRVASTTDSEADLLRAAGPSGQLTENSEPAGSTEQQQDRDAQQEHKPKSSYQKRIDKLVRERSELQARLAKYEAPGAMENRVFGEINRRRQAAQQSNGNGAGRESLSQSAAPLEHETKETSGAAANGNVSQQGQPDPQWVAEHNARAVEFERRLTGNPELQQEFQAAVAQARADGLKLDPVVFHGLVDLPNGEIVATYILENRDVFDELHSLKTPAKKIAELHRISAGLDFHPPERLQPASRAPARTPPPPLSPVKGSATRSSIPEDDLSYSEWAAKRNSPGAVKERQRRGYGI